MPMKIHQSKLDAAKIILREVYRNKILFQETRGKKSQINNLISNLRQLGKRTKKT